MAAEAQQLQTWMTQMGQSIQGMNTEIAALRGLMEARQSQTDSHASLLNQDQGQFTQTDARATVAETRMAAIERAMNQIHADMRARPAASIA